jgi:Fic family protein
LAHFVLNRPFNDELLGKASLDKSTEQSLDTLLANIIASSAIEAEQLNVESVRSSLAKHLGLSSGQPYPTSDRSEGLAAMMMDALQNQHEPLTTSRLFQWHEWLFPPPKEDEWSSQTLIVGKLRGDEPMQLVSGRLDRQTVHFEAPPRSQLEQELEKFIEWFNQSIRLYAMSVAILDNRERYYQVLEQSQSFDSAKDLTPWLLWFFDTLDESLNNAINTIDRTLIKTQYWQQHHDSGISASQYQKVAKVSKATATRHLSYLLEKGCIEKLAGGGRSTRYRIKR